MKNKTLIKNEENKTQNKEINNLKKDKIMNNTLFNKNNRSKKEESKLSKDKNIPNLSLKENRLKSSRLKNPYKLTYSRNYNDYNQILTELTDINTSKINWALKLRKDELMNIIEEKGQNENKRKLRIASAKPTTRGLVLTSNFIEPKFYMEDLEKYKKKLKNKRRPLSSVLNPNFNNVKHLFTNKINLQSKEFASSLRSYNINKNKIEKIKWNNCFTNCNKSRDSNYYTKFLLPKTEEGKKNYRRIEKRVFQPYSVVYKDIVLGNDTVKQKILTPKKDFSYSGVGSYLDLGKYRTNYGVKNTSLNANILKTETNSQCLFELGLRNYPKLKVKS